MEKNGQIGEKMSPSLTIMANGYLNVQRKSLIGYLVREGKSRDLMNHSGVMHRSQVSFLSHSEKPQSLDPLIAKQFFSCIALKAICKDAPAWEGGLPLSDLKSHRFYCNGHSPFCHHVEGE